MSSPKDTPFTKPNSESQYGKTPLESWVGTVVSYDAQKEQIEGGWGWRYKVRIMGDNTNTDQISDDQLSYAYVLLPTTAGSGGAYKMRSVRISQGDFVYGVRGGGAGAPTMILGVFPRTRGQSSGSGNFANTSGFTGALQKTKVLSGEFNEQTGPVTPGVHIKPLSQNKSNSPNTQDALARTGVEIDGDTDTEELFTPPETDETEKYNVGDSITKQQLKYILLSWPTNLYTENEVIDAINQAVTQNLISQNIAEDAIKKVKQGNGNEAFRILFPVTFETTPSE